MRIGVMSDTHGHIGGAGRALAKMGVVDLVLHLGDHRADAEEIEQRYLVQTVAVAGNTDFAAGDDDEHVEVVEGLRIYMTHGHRFRVNRSLAMLQARAAELDADVALYGHTHEPHLETREGVLFLNPGALSRDTTNPSCAIIETGDGTCKAQLIDVDFVC